MDTAMRFSELLRCSQVRAEARDGDPEVAFVTDDSRACRDGACFVAARGPVADGHGFIEQAVAAGATSIVCEPRGEVPQGVAFATTPDSREALGPLAQASLGWPARSLTCTGITGTNGKTTVAALLGGILQRSGSPCATLGTIAYRTGQRDVVARTTTPGAAELALLMAEALSGGSTHLVMEASSHALDQRRTAGVPFAVGVFTNLSGDHLDYHQTMDSYLAAKRRLFEALTPDATAVVNRDDPASTQIVSGIRARVLGFALDAPADVSGEIERLDGEGSGFTLRHAGAEVPVRTRLIGRHNVSNCLAAAAAATALGVDLPAIADALGVADCVAGRLEAVTPGSAVRVFVDYAHTDDALQNVLASLRPLRDGGRLTVVFGCGGDRDRSKRPRMARVASRGADRIFVTSDNPRSEDPARIIDEILEGLDQTESQGVEVEPDRATAVTRAIETSEPGDIVLIAGKGHEDYQIFGDRRIHFSDVEVAREALARREGVS
jgi:UDP-N-acetylmuramoyl-L-alanyl-D-glutamate--2,6-diaminopimelate ligase